jgi:hypothetical protein
MISNSYNLSEDWGWYVDIETLKPIYQIKTEFVKINNKKLNYHLNRLDPIEEDAYDYYINNKIDRDYEEEKFEIKVIEPNKGKDSPNIITAYGSTTLITALLTCIIFFVI